MEQQFSPKIKSESKLNLSIDHHSDFDGDTNHHSDEHFDSQNNLRDAAWLASQPKLNAKSKSGYILFSAEVRKRIMLENPDAGFGEVSKIVGIEWKKLNYEAKRQYEIRAQYIADERAKAESSTPLCKPGQILVYVCRWDKCNYHFNCQDGLYEHVKTSHTDGIDMQRLIEISRGDISIEKLEDHKFDKHYVCLWNACSKYRRDGKPFPSVPRMLRHIKEKHLNTSARAINIDQRSKNYFVYYTPEQLHQQTGNTNTPSTSKNTEFGRFVHHPYGIQPINALATTIATPTRTPPHSLSYSSASINATNNGGVAYMTSGATSGNVQYSSGAPAGASNFHYEYASSSNSTTQQNSSWITANSGGASVQQNLTNNLNSNVYLSNGTTVVSTTVPNQQSVSINGCNSNSSAPLLNGNNNTATHYLIHQSSTPHHVQYQQHAQSTLPSSSTTSISSNTTVQYVAATPAPTSHFSNAVATNNSSSNNQVAHQVIYQLQVSGANNTQSGSAPIHQYVQANINGTTVYIPAGAQYQTYLINPNGTLTPAQIYHQTQQSTPQHQQSTNGLNSQSHQIVVHQQPLQNANVGTPLQSLVTQSASNVSHVYMQQAALNNSAQQPSSTILSNTSNGNLSSGTSYVATGVNGATYQFAAQTGLPSSNTIVVQTPNSQVIQNQLPQQHIIYAQQSQQPTQTTQQFTAAVSVSAPTPAPVVNGMSYVVNSSQNTMSNYQTYVQTSLHSYITTTTNVVSTYTPQQQIVTSATIQSSPAQLQQHQQYNQQMVMDTGRTVVQHMAKPVFVPPSNSVQVKRVLHSEAYVKYIESLYNTKQQKTISKWDKSLQANNRNTVSNYKKLPYEWLKTLKNGNVENLMLPPPTPSKKFKTDTKSSINRDNGLTKEDQETIKSFWRLRDQLLENTTKIQRYSTTVNGTANGYLDL